MRHAHPRSATALATLLAAAVAGCGADPVGVRPADDTSAMYWSLSVDHPAVTLALAEPHAALAVTATPRTRTGAALAGLPPATFHSMNQTIVGVSADGVVSARKRGTTQVVATLAHAGVTHTDTIAVTVTATAPAEPLDTLDLIPPDIVSVGEYNYLFPSSVGARLATTTGAGIAGAVVAYRSLDPTTLLVDRRSGAVTAVRGGEALVAASATAYGVTRHDTLLVRVLPPVLMLISTPPVRTADGRVVRAFSPSTATIAVGGSVGFVNGSLMEYPADSIDVAFDDPAAAEEDQMLCFCGSGNISPFVTPPWQWFTRMRRFTKAGRYTYRSAITGETGTIVVVDP